MNMKLTMLCAAALLFSGSAAFAQGCSKSTTAPCEQSKKETPAAGKEKKDQVTPRKLAADEIGKEAVCPVTGEKFKVTAKTVSVSYKEKVYYFCCPGCDKSFSKNPEKYLNKKAAAPAKIFVCPMGDYQGDKPGKCPKCGMNLVGKK